MARSRRHRRRLRVREAAAPRYAPSPSAGALTGVLLDSDVIIDVLRGDADTIAALRRLESGGTPTYCCPISWAEIFAGVRPGEDARAEGFFDARGEVGIDAMTGRRAGAYLLRYRRSHGVQIADALVAAAASTAGLHLWTLNVRHYPMDDLRLFRPARP
jgi:hypothetical protein